MKEKKNWLVPVLLLAVMLLFIVALLIDLIPILVQVVKDHSDESRMVSYIDAYGSKGMFLIIGLQALQVIVAFIPAAIIQVLAGLCYGVWGGAALCIVGYILGNVVVFVALRQFGQVLGPLFPRKSKPKKVASSKQKKFSLQRITQMEHPQRAAFLLYLIPGIPNGILPYLFARSKITFLQYLVAVVSASVPSVLLCTWLGERLSKGDWLSAILIAVAVVALAGIALLFKNKIMGAMSSQKAKENGKEASHGEH